MEVPAAAPVALEEAATALRVVAAEAEFDSAALGVGAAAPVDSEGAAAALRMVAAEAEGDSAASEVPATPPVALEEAAAALGVGALEVGGGHHYYHCELPFSKAEEDIDELPPFSEDMFTILDRVHHQLEPLALPA